MNLSRLFLLSRQASSISAKTLLWALIFWAAPTSQAQGLPNDGTSKFAFDCGMSVMTCFSGSKSAAFTDQCNNSTQADTNGIVLGIMDTRNPSVNAPGFGVNWMPPMFHNNAGAPAHQWRARNLGEVFGIALDNQNPPNIYVAATSVYPNENPGPGGWGAVYKINGTTFNISTFSSLSGVGTVSLGNVCFDKGNQQFFVADLDHGWIRRLNNAGAEVLPHFDHGIQGATPTIADNGTPNELTASGRRVFGLQVYANRLYYSVWYTGKNEIWSVGLDGSGNFITTGPNGPRPEVTSPVFPSTLQNDTPVTDIAFSQNGKMLVGERGLCTAVLTNLNTGPAHHSRALEFTLSGTTWTFNKQYNIGPAGFPNNTEGGVDYSCDDLVYATGDLFAPNGFPNPPLIYGLAILTPASTGSQTSYLIDADGDTATADKNFLGDVEVYRCCDCITFNNERLECLGNNSFNWSFCVTNTGTLTNGHLVILDLPPGVTVDSQIINLNPPLAPGEGACTSITFTLSPDVKTNTLCFRVAAHTPDFNECCVIPKCLNLPDCCGIIGSESIKCDSAAGTFSWSMTITNLSGVTAAYLVVVPDPAGCASVVNPVIALTPPLANGQSTNLTITIAATNAPCDQACLRISLHDKQFVSCCSFTHCISLRCKDGNHPPVLDCPPNVRTECDPAVGKNYVINAGVMDPDGDALTVTWKINGNPVQTNTIPAGISLNFTLVSLTHNYSPGLYTVTLCVTDGFGAPVICEMTLEMGDHTPPSLQCPPDRTVDVWPKGLPNLLGQLVVSDNCSPPQKIILTQQPPPGSPITNSPTCITFTATDEAGNVATCTTCINFLPVHLRGFEGLADIVGTFTTVAPASFTLSVDGDIANTSGVEYFVNDLSIGTGKDIDFRLPWSNVPAGSYAIVAEARNADTPPLKLRSSTVYLYLAAPGAPTQNVTLGNILLEDGQLNFSFPSLQGIKYFIEATDSLESPDWQAINQIVGDGQVHSLRMETSGHGQFIRIRSE